MKITITLTRTDNGKSYDIQVADNQKIRDTLDVLQTNLPMFTDLSETVEVRVAEDGKRIDIENTYQEVYLYSGTELLIRP